MKKLVMIMVTLLLFTSCASEPTSSNVDEDSIINVEEVQTRIFVDSVGREVEIPIEIKSIAPSGPLAQVVLYTAVPDLLVGRATDFSKEAEKYIDEKYINLPKFGQFYGKSASLNMEEILLHSPDVIIDIGEPKKTVVEDMNMLQEQLGIPVIFIECSLETAESTYKKIGELTGETEKCDLLAQESKNIVTNAKTISDSLAEEDKVSVYLAMGDAGLHTDARASFHAEVMNRVGVINVADVEATSAGAGTEISFEQLLLWNPDIILANNKVIYIMITTDDLWSSLDAVKNGKVYTVPTVPYSFLNNPPSLNRLIGIEWLGGIAYPEFYSDTTEKVQSFYKNFYSIDITDQEMGKRQPKHTLTKNEST